MKSGDKNKIILILQKKIEYLELNINDLNLIIQHLRNDIHKKENVLHLLTDTNTQLKSSLDTFSKQLDEKILEINKKPIKKFKNSKSLNKLFSKRNSNTKTDEENKHTELDNAINLNKILQKDNENLKNLLNSYGSMDRMKNLEDMNKKLKEQNTNLNEEIFKIKKEIVDHNYCENKRKTLVEQVIYLTEENKRYKNDIKKFTAINEELTKNINLYKYILKIKNININDYLNDNLITDININNNNDTSLRDNLNINKYTNKLVLKSPRLPNITKSKKTLENENNKLNNKSNIIEKKDEDLENLLDKDEINILIKLFQGDEKKYSEFKKKIIIYAKSKESIINKYKLEEKNLNKKIFSMQEQVEYLNHKVKESEMRIKIFQQQLNDSNYQKKKFKKKYVEEKKEKEETKQKFKDFKKINELIIMNKLKDDKNKCNDIQEYIDEKSGNEENVEEENDNEYNEDDENNIEN